MDVLSLQGQRLAPGERNRRDEALHAKIQYGANALGTGAIDSAAADGTSWPALLTDLKRVISSSRPWPGAVPEATMPRSRSNLRRGTNP